MFPPPSYPDLTPYPSAADEMLGLQPLAVGWLKRGKNFPTAKPDQAFVKRLARFCQPDGRVFEFQPPLRCALENHQVEPMTVGGMTMNLGSGELRIIGDEDIFAAPDLIWHYVVVHHYQPPPEFVAAVMNGPTPETAEFRALLRTLRQV